MKLHGNARTCPRSRRLLVERVEAGWPLGRAAAAAGVSVRTAAKWCARWQAEGEQGLLDRSSRPLRQPRRTPADRVEAVLRLRRLRMTAAGIAEVLRMALSTVSLILKRAGLGRRSPVGAAPAGQPLRASAAGRARPPRHREARPLRPCRPPAPRPRPRTLRDRRRLRVPRARYLISVRSLNIGRYIEMTIVPTMAPTQIISSGSMIDVSDAMLASTSSS